jgi:hypothetical protein
MITKAPTSRFEITWLQAAVALLAPVLAVGAAWGANSRDWARANEKLEKLEPALSQVIHLQTLVDQHLKTGAHTKADQRLHDLEVEQGKAEVRYKEILRRLDDLRNSMTRENRR